MYDDIEFSGDNIYTTYVYANSKDSHFDTLLSPTNEALGLYLDTFTLVSFSEDCRSYFAEKVGMPVLQYLYIKDFNNMLLQRGQFFYELKRIK